MQKKTWIFFSYFFFLNYIIPDFSFAMDAIIGRVVSLDYNNGTMTIEPLKRFVVSENISQPNDINATPNEIPLVDSKTISVRYSSDQLPRCVVQGQTIRLWGNFIKDDTFQALWIRGFRGAGHNDPTGVRLRFIKGKGSCRRNPMR
ncbi:MAG: hypothetical protein HQK77_18940 [Desulfobacterales bacterium]|nr:hypothetical protein [Desulfobacterales bacterium]